MACIGCKEARQQLIEGLKQGKFLHVMEAVTKGARLILDRSGPRPVVRELTASEKDLMQSDPVAFVDLLIAKSYPEEKL